MPDHHSTQDEPKPHAWLSTACTLIATWMVYGFSVRTGIPVTPETLRVALAHWLTGIRRA